MTTSTKNRPKPAKPTADFPLFPHACGQWAKKVRNRLCYFGIWENPNAALALWQFSEPYLREGLPVPSKLVADDLVELGDLCNFFLGSKAEAVKAGKLVQRSYDEYQGTCDRLIKWFGRTRSVGSLGPSDFSRVMSKLVAKYGPIRQKNEVKRIRGIFKYGCANGLVPTLPVYGSEFVPPSESELRRHRASKAKKLFDRLEIHRLIEKASVSLKAMIYLGINCGLGNADIGQLEWKHLDLEAGLEYRSGVAKTSKSKHCLSFRDDAYTTSESKSEPGYRQEVILNWPRPLIASRTIFFLKCLLRLPSLPSHFERLRT